MRSRFVASSCILINTQGPGSRSSNHACSELSHWMSSPKAARLGRALRCLALRPFASHRPSSIIQSRSVEAFTSPGAWG
jgi:hypothetical protein